MGDGFPPLPTNRAYTGISLNGFFGNGTGRVRVITIAADYWLIMLILLATAFGLRKLAKRRPRPGVCAKCGYDLRGTPDRCPECGTPAHDAKAEAAKATA